MVEAPFLLHPPIVGVEGGVQQIGALLRALLDGVHQRSVDESGVKPLLVHDFEAPIAVLEFRPTGFQPTVHEQLSDRLSIRVDPAVPGHERAWHRHDLERRIRDVVGDLPAHRQLLAALHLDPGDGLARRRFVEMAREAVLLLVEVIVGVVDRVDEFAHLEPS